MHPHRYPIITLVLAIISCARLLAEEKDWRIELSRGYASDAKQPLLDFLNDWHAKSKPISPELLKKKPVFERAVYDLYRAFFKPGLEQHFEYRQELLMVPGHDYKNTQFIVIQDKIDVHIVDSDLSRVFDAKTLKRRSLDRGNTEISHLVCEDFRPNITLDGKKLLYLERDRLAAMLGFLTEDNGYRMIDRYWDEDCLGERQKRLGYLNSAMKIFHGHWLRGWHFETHPYVNAIYIGADFKKAVLLYRYRWGGGEALMTRENDGDWKIVSMELSWQA